MAGIVKTKGASGLSYSIRLSKGENKNRPKIALGTCTLSDARTAQANIESLIVANRTGRDLSVKLLSWIDKLPDDTRLRLERLGLIEPAGGSRWTVDAFVQDYINRRTDVKEPTRRKWRDVESKLVAFFRGDNVGDVTVNQAKNFRVHLQTTCGLSENSIRRQIGICRQFFNAAVDAEIIVKNPFRGQAVSVRANKARFFYVTAEMAQKVLGACPDAQWRLIFGLTRFGGLRCPSEVLRLKWQDVDFEHDRFTVHASKTAHHADSGIRTVPMFPELKPLFQDAFDNAPDGSVYCIEKTRDTTVNLRTQMKRIIKRAGLDEWPKLFQNCRSTRETELFKSTQGNIKAVCEWIGNSPEVAMNHYAQLTDADMKEAAEKAVILKGLNRGLFSDETECNGVQDENKGNTVTPCDSTNKEQFALACNDAQEGVKWAIRDSNPGPAD